MKRKFLIILLMVLSVAACAFGVTACGDEPDDNEGGQSTVQTPPEEEPDDTEKPSVVEVTGVTLNKDTLSLEVGENETLTATVEPSNATDKTVTWKSSDSSVAKVESGKVTALKKGSATITATVGGKSATCQVTVNEKVIAVTGVTLNKDTLSLEVGENETLTATVEPSNATDKTVTWKSSDNTVAKVESGKVTALKTGSATITATAGVKSATCKVTVNNVITEILLDFTELTIKTEETFTLTATILPTNATDSELEWISSNTKVATVSNDGTVTAIASGTALIIVSSSNGVQARCNVTVEQNNHGLELRSLINRPNELCVASYTGQEEKIEIPSYFEGKPITGIVSFSGNKSVKEVIIPNTVTTIYGGAFKGCENLVSVDIPESVTKLGEHYSDGVFSGCKNLQNLTVPFVGNQSKTSQDDHQDPFGIIFGKNYYDGAEQVTQVYISSGATHSVSKETYCIPRSLKHVTVLSGNILYGAFYDCKMIESITLKDKVISIGDEAFWDCSGLTSVTIPDSVTFIGNNAFFGCSELTSVTIGNGVTSIGHGAFGYCKKLVNITWGKQLASIGNEAFSYCYSLTKIYLPDNIYLGYFIFLDCKDLTVSYGVISRYNYWDVISFSSASISDGGTVLRIENAKYVKKEKR